MQEQGAFLRGDARDVDPGALRDAFDLLVGA
jgi:hypothetical protein